MRDIIIFWIQWSGKGTQAALLTEKYPNNFSYFSSGDLFRTLLATDNPIGNYLKHRMEQGQLINDNVTNSLFNAFFYTVVDDAQYMLLDWYPRSVDQLDLILKLLAENDRKPLGIRYTVPDEIVKERMKSRWRSDDTDEAIQKRIDQFYEKTMPVIEFFKNNADIIEINADDTIENIHKNTVEAIERYI